MLVLLWLTVLKCFLFLAMSISGQMYSISGEVPQILPPTRSAILSGKLDQTANNQLYQPATHTQFGKREDGHDISSLTTN
jgi:hypothetical protein